MTFSVIVPTIWSHCQVSRNLNVIISSDLVGELILVDNNPAKCNLDLAFLSSPKLKRICCGSNIYVNPAWNLGFKRSRFNYLAFINDDVVVNVGFLSNIQDALNQPDIGLIGFSGDSLFSANFLTTELRNQDFGCAMFLKKINYSMMPPGMLVYFGDDYLFQRIRMKGLQVAVVGAVLRSESVFSVSTDCLSTRKKSFLLEKDKVIYFIFYLWHKLSLLIRNLFPVLPFWRFAKNNSSFFRDFI